MSEERRQDRRGRYSFRGHLRRLRTAGRLKTLGLATATVLVIAAVTFARCESSRVSGPREATSPPSQGPRGNLTTDVSLPKTALALWPAKLLTLLNPCVPDLHFTRHEGKNQVTYTDEREKDGFGNYTGNHKTTYEMDEDDDADDEDGNHYHGHKHTPSPAWRLEGFAYGVAGGSSSPLSVYPGGT